MRVAQRSASTAVLVNIALIAVWWIISFGLDRIAERVGPHIGVDLAIIIATVVSIPLAVKYRAKVTGYFLTAWLAFFAVQTIEEAIYGSRALHSVPDKMTALTAAIAAVILTLTLQRYLSPSRNTDGEQAA